MVRLIEIWKELCPKEKLARNAGIDVIVVGVGNSVNQTELSGIASRKHFHHH